MPFHPAIPVPERILSYGPWGSGKTFDWLMIAKFYQQTKTPGHFYAIDNEGSSVMRVMLTEFPGLDAATNENGNVTVVSPEDWQTLRTATNNFKLKATADDWFIVDPLGASWGWVQGYFAAKVYGKDLDEYFLQARINARETKKKGGSPFEGFTDWPTINEAYQAWFNGIIRMRSHVYFTAMSDKINNETDTQMVRLKFSGIGEKPKGQKGVPFVVHTVLYKSCSRAGEYRITTAGKDRGREMMEGTVVKSFPLDYLKKVAGWSL